MTSVINHPHKLKPEKIENKIVGCCQALKNPVINWVKKSTI